MRQHPAVRSGLLALRRSPLRSSLARRPFPPLYPLESIGRHANQCNPSPITSKPQCSNASHTIVKPGRLNFGKTPRRPSPRSAAPGASTETSPRPACRNPVQSSARFPAPIPVSGQSPCARRNCASGHPAVIRSPKAASSPARASGGNSSLAATGADAAFQSLAIQRGVGNVGGPPSRRRNPPRPAPDRGTSRRANN